MFDSIKAFGHRVGHVFHQLMTGKDGQTHDIGRWSWFLSTATVTGGATWNMVKDGRIELWIFTQCLIALVAAHGLALFAKSGTEPPAAPSVDLPKPPEPPGK